MFERLESALGHRFSQPGLLRLALTHRSHHYENLTVSPGHFERLEFLGDSILDFLLAEALMKRFAEVDEGTLSKWRASLVNESALAKVSAGLRLHDHVLLGRSEEARRSDIRPRLLSSIFEAVLAAIYLDGGLAPARKLVEECFAPDLESLDPTNEFGADFKSRFQEWTQKRFRVTPEYRLLDTVGPEHAKRFRCEVLVQERKMGEGEGGSRKAAEQDAARTALVDLEKRGEM